MKDLVNFTNRAFDPFRMLDDVERDMRKIINSMNWRYPEFSETPFYNTLTNVKMSDKDSHYLVSVDMPGVPKENIKVQASEGQLSISGERKSEIGTEGEAGSSYGRFERTFTLPNNVDVDKIEAQYENGVLSLALPKTEAAKAKQITISEGNKSGIWQKLLTRDKTEDKKDVNVESKTSKAA